MADSTSQSSNPITPSYDEAFDQAKKSTVRAERVAKKERAKAERLAVKAKAKEKRQRVKPLAKMAQAKILEDLGSSLETHARAATFACGGSVSFKTVADETVESGPLKNSNEPDQQALDAISSPTSDDTKLASACVDDVQVRFGPAQGGITVVFGNNGLAWDGFELLIKACRPASFGRDGEAVLDEGHRKAGKFDRSQFATSFCPYEAGIIDVAELHKLNVYSAPNGKFKPHVDTPRSNYQIGSLVVCLLVAHQGGQLTISNAGAASQNVVFDWSTINDNEPARIKWAAFYSNCEHEVREVTSGHRVTLAYNLFLTRDAGHLAGDTPALDSTQLPFYEGLADALENPGFFRRGRVLAVYLTHCYAHTSAHVNFLPDSLKGADMSLWNTARALGLKCKVVPIMSVPWGYDYDGPTELYEPKFGVFNGKSPGGFDLEEGGESWGREVPWNKVTWPKTSGDASKQTSDDEPKAKVKAKTFKEVQMAYMAYGSEPGIGINYARAAMLICIPPYHERGSGRADPKSIGEGIKLDPAEYEDYGHDDDAFSYSSFEESDEEDVGMEMDDDEDDGEDNIDGVVEDDEQNDVEKGVVGAWV